jgi:hypothetical protein
MIIKRLCRITFARMNVSQAMQEVQVIPFSAQILKRMCFERRGFCSADPVCKGEDFHAIMSNTSVDIGSVHLYPEFWQVCTE